MKENELVTVVTLAGEMVGKIISKTDTCLTLENPRMLIKNENAKEFGFIKGIAISGIAHPDVVEVHQWILICRTDPVFIDAYKRVLEIGENEENE